ncbi:hypothetical protein A2961_03640 [Candidatus Woesebacteria bacterium RIFCSPLOWO2_01_FULL_39_21]|uniref:Uncharacterized protein n=1 Tax=Candidatus Woesebacteria bacterium RIFCSPLOWO2_01_FULL_39_21 TaxID=1802519 RepID=A0A1F8BBI1_9BACT|nr:MAG: hypothetical protein A2691_04205 [Candidatus Woesebacteria bacterium RIFCSPHIGHO2_01_FULL_39_23]OGM61373.1 MAG: hypothetical protein A2961_03640 [Candidatus Woesebacteria bacterium RIFCSPLOWO2_01_FULL_39_21]
MAKYVTFEEAGRVVDIALNLQGGDKTAPLIDPVVQANAARDLGIISESVASAIREAANAGHVKGDPEASAMASGHPTVSSERRG